MLLNDFANNLTRNCASGNNITTSRYELKAKMKPIVASAISAPLSGRYFPKKVIRRAAINGRTTINQVYSAKAPPSVYVSFPSARKVIKLLFTISTNQIHQYLQFFYF